MRLTSKQYAKALFLLTKDLSSKDEIREKTAGFTSFLADNNQLSLAKSILDDFSRIWNEHKGIVEARITSAGDLEKKTEELILSYIKGRYPDKKIQMEKTVDKGVKGGFILRMEDKVIDASLDTVLTDLRKELNK
jgi:ATP synthase F1 delta subunit